MSEEKLIHIGTFGKALGLKGEIRIISYTTNFNTFMRNGNLIHEDGSTKWDFEQVRISKGKLIARLKNINNRKDIECLRGQKIFVQRIKFPKTKKNEFYVVDLINCKVNALRYGSIGSQSNIN